MAQTIVDIYAPSGAKVGHFVDPTVEMLPEHNYFITGRFFDEAGKLLEKIEFNPQVLPYAADISGVSKCNHLRLSGVYVQRSRQPIEMTGVCQIEAQSQ